MYLLLCFSETLNLSLDRPKDLPDRVNKQNTNTEVILFFTNWGLGVINSYTRINLYPKDVPPGIRLY